MTVRPEKVCDNRQQVCNNLELVCDNHQQACDDRAWFSIKVDVENQFPQAEFHHLRQRVLGVHDLQCGIKRMILN